MIIARAAVPNGQPANSGLDLEQVKWVEGTAYGLPVTLSILPAATQPEGYFDLVAEVNGFHVAAHAMDESLDIQAWTKALPKWLKDSLKRHPEASKWCLECFGLGWVEDVRITGWSIEREETIEEISHAPCACVLKRRENDAKAKAIKEANEQRHQAHLLDVAIDGIPF